MSASGVAAIDHTIQETNIWLKEIAAQLHFEDRHHAYNALRAVLHALRDRLTPETAVHLGAQFPLLIGGIYYEGWRMAGKPTGDRSAQEFADHILEQLPRSFPWIRSLFPEACSKCCGRGSIWARRQRSSIICRGVFCGLRSPGAFERGAALYRHSA